MNDSGAWPGGLEDETAWSPSPGIDGTPGVAAIAAAPLGGRQLPGDLNQDSNVDISDAISLLGHLFAGNPAALPCGDGTTSDPANLELLDVNGDSGVNLTDAIALLTWLFRGGAEPVLGRECIRIPGCSETCTP